MPRPYRTIGNFRVAPFKYAGIEPYGNFANTTAAGDFPVKQKILIDGQTKTFNWPSSEHAYHAQKILYAKSTLPSNDPRQAILTGLLNDIEKHNGVFDPRKAYRPMVENMLKKHKHLHWGTKPNVPNSYATFNELCGCVPNNLKIFMRTVIHLKFAHPKAKQLRQVLMDCAREGIIPIEISQHDESWASGKSGKGGNWLGVLLLEEGNRLLKQNGEKPNNHTDDPWITYEKLRRTHANDLQHDKFVKHAGRHSLVPKPPHWTNWQAKKLTAVSSTSTRLFSAANTHQSAKEKLGLTHLNSWTNAEQGTLNVDVQRSAPLQLVFDSSGQFNKVIYKPVNSTTWRNGDLSNPGAALLMLAFKTDSKHHTPPTNTNTWFDQNRNHFVFESKRNSDLQLHFHPNGTIKRVMYRDPNSHQWAEGDLKHPAATRLYNHFKSKIKVMAAHERQSQSTNSATAQTNRTNTGPH